jgi:fibronectin-binding autotransporter adhesin
MTIADGASLSIGVALQVGDWAGTGVVNQTGGSVIVRPTCDNSGNCASLNVGNQGGTGIYNISGGLLELHGGLNTLGRNNNNNDPGNGTMNISGGEVRILTFTRDDVVGAGNLIIGDRDLNTGVKPESTGLLNQTGGTLHVSAGSNLFLSGFGSGTYNLNGGTLEIGGSSLKARYNNQTSSYAFNLGGGTIEVIGSELVTAANLDATLVGETVSTFDTGTWGADWQGKLLGEGGLVKLGESELKIGGLSNQIDVLRIAEGAVLLGSSTLFKDSNTATTLDLAVGTRLEVTGNFSLGEEDNFVVGIDAEGQSARIDVSGAAELDGATLTIDATSGYKANHNYTIVTAASFNQGNADDTFQIAPHDFAFVTPELLFGNVGTELYLRLQRTAAHFADAAETANQAAAANGLESVSGPSALYDAVEVLATADAPAAFDAISGEIHAAATSALLNESFFLRDAVLGRLQYPSRASSAPSTSLVSGYAEGDKRSAAPFPGASAPAADPNTFWTQAYGSWGHSDGNGNAAKLDRSTGGVLVGYDHSFGQDWLIGAAAGYSRTSFDLDDRASSGDSDNYHLLAYAGGTFAAVNVRLGASYSWNEVDTTRNVALPGFYEQVKADYSAGTTQLFGELSHDFAVTPATTLSPFAGLAYVHLSTDGYNETGGSAALHVDGSNQSVTYGTLGLRADHKIAVGGVGVTLQGAAAWQHAWGDVTPVSTLAFAGGDAFQVTGAPIAEDALLLKAGFDVDVTAGAKFGLFYAGQLASDAADNSIQGRFSVAF